MKSCNYTPSRPTIASKTVNGSIITNQKAWCAECGESVRGQWRIYRRGQMYSERRQHHIECWVKSKNVQQIEIPRELMGFHYFHKRWKLRCRMMQDDGVRVLPKQNAWLELEDMERITKLLCPDLIMPQSLRYEMGIENIDTMTVKQLRQQLWSRNVRALGNKRILKQTLQDYMNGERCSSLLCYCQYGINFDTNSDLPPCYRAKRFQARKKRSEYISFGFCRRMEKGNITNDHTTLGSQQGLHTLQQEKPVLSKQVPLVLKQLIFKYYDMIMY